MRERTKEKGRKEDFQRTIVGYFPTEVWIIWIEEEREIEEEIGEISIGVQGGSRSRWLRRKSERLHARKTVTRRGFYMRHRRAGTNRTRPYVSTTVHVRNDALDRSCETRGYDPLSRTHGDKCGAGDDVLRVLQNVHPVGAALLGRHGV